MIDLIERRLDIETSPPSRIASSAFASQQPLVWLSVQVGTHRVLMERWIKDWFDKNFHDRLRNAIRDGGHTQLSGTTRCLGNFHGARTVLQYVAKKTDAQSRWLQDLIARRGYNRASVALANKNARIIQALLSSGRAYELAAAP